MFWCAARTVVLCSTLYLYYFLQADLDELGKGEWLEPGFEWARSLLVMGSCFTTLPFESSAPCSPGYHWYWDSKVMALSSHLK